MFCYLHVITFTCTFGDMVAKPKKKSVAGVKRGRPERNPIEIYRTTFWARAVYAAAKAPRHKLGPVLGKDGRWLGVWARYDKGLVSPSRDRLKRIEKRLPGTNRYYFCPLWGLLYQRAFTWDDLYDSVMWLNPPVRVAFIAEDESASGPFWRKATSRFDLLDELIRLLGDRKFTFDALIAILIVVREAELCQDAWLYLFAMRAWSLAPRYMTEHPVLRHFPVDLIESVLTPLRTIRFADTDADSAWSGHVAAYRKSKPYTSHIDSSLNIIDLVRTLPGVDIAR